MGSGRTNEGSGRGQANDLAHALHAAEASERAFARRLHRVHDPKGMELLRGLRARITSLKQRLSADRQP